MTVQNATVAGAFKTLIESAGLSLTAYRDHAPEGATLPYVTVIEGISVVPDKHTQAFDKSVNRGVRETVQVDLWQTWRGTNGKVAENYTLPGSLAGVLHGAKLPTSPTHVFGVILVNMIRMVEDDTNLVHHAITVELWRDL